MPAVFSVFYFARGETEGYNSGKTFDWSTYKWCSNGSYQKLAKYCTDSSYGDNGFTDGKTELDIDDDAAYVNWGTEWRMPSEKQVYELRTECTWEWTTKDNVNGYVVTGQNDNSIFLPAAGYRFGSSLIGAGSSGRYWSRALREQPVLSAWPGLRFERHQHAPQPLLRSIRAPCAGFKMSILSPNAQSCCGAEPPAGRETGREAAPQQRLSASLGCMRKIRPAEARYSARSRPPVAFFFARRPAP